MKEMYFTTHVGDQIMDVSVTGPAGIYKEFWVTIDGEYEVAMMKKFGQWLISSIKPHNLTTDDIQILGELIDQETGKL